MSNLSKLYDLLKCSTGASIEDTEFGPRREIVVFSEPETLVAGLLGIFASFEGSLFSFNSFGSSLLPSPLEGEGKRLRASIFVIMAMVDIVYAGCFFPAFR